MPADQAEAALTALRSTPDGREAVPIAHVVNEDHGRVVARTLSGSRRLVDMLVGKQLPRIC